MISKILGLSILLCAANAEAEPRMVRHVFVIVLENESADSTFGAATAATYLARDLRARGAFLPNYFGIGHWSLDNYLAMISGQAPNAETQDDCPIFSAFKPSGPVQRYGQQPGKGCVYPPSVPTLPDQLEAVQFAWTAYMEDMGNVATRESATCGHPAIGQPDLTEAAVAEDQYATRHNPFVYFRSIIDDRKRCDAHVVNLKQLNRDLQRIETTPHFVFVTPNLCHDGHDAPCVNGEAGGLKSADAFLQTWVPQILASPAYRQDGLLIVTFDEAGSNPKEHYADACCAEQALPGETRSPGMVGPGGGRIGLVALSPFIRPGTVVTGEFNHYGLLKTLEDIFGLEPLGFAAQPSVHSFKSEILSSGAD